MSLCYVSDMVPGTGYKKVNKVGNTENRKNNREHIIKKISE